MPNYTNIIDLDSVERFRDVLDDRMEARGKNNKHNWQSVNVEIEIFFDV